MAIRFPIDRGKERQRVYLHRHSQAHYSQYKERSEHLGQCSSREWGVRGKCQESSNCTKVHTIEGDTIYMLTPGHTSIGMLGHIYRLAILQRETHLQL